MDPAGKVVAITGGARGIGRATAAALTGAGARVAIGDIDELALKETASDLDVLGQALDVTSRESFEAFLDTVEAKLGSVDVLVNNAGIMPLGRLVDEPDDVTRRIVEINLLGAINGTKLAVSRMSPRGSGQIINVSSAVGRVAVAHAATYSATKFAVVGLTEAVRSELRGTGIDVSVILPSIVKTELGAGLDDKGGKRSVEPEDVAEAILKTIRRPRFETWVPHSAYRMWKPVSILPRRMFDFLSNVGGEADILANNDPVARAAYEERARKG
jgi:NAD(P)-dependent dehydrogenase (short-subunit alcohol dehydrogenase family)